MSEPDLSFVDPDRRDEVARRIAVVNKYLKNPSRAAAEEGAAEIGLSTPQFYNLARSWRETGRAETVPGSKRRKTRTFDVFTPKHRALLRAMEAQSPQTSIENLAAAAGRAMAKEGMTGFGRSAIRKRLIAIRLERTAGQPAGRGLAIEHCAIDLAVETPEGATMAIASMVIDLERRRILGVSIGIDAPSPERAAAAMLDALDRCGPDGLDDPAAPLPLLLSVDQHADWRGLVRVLEDGGLLMEAVPFRKVGGGTLLMRVMGPEVFGVPSRPRQTLRPVRDRRPSGKPTPHGVAATLAEKTLRGRLDADNRANPVGLRIGDVARAELIRGLVAITSS